MTRIIGVLFEFEIGQSGWERERAKSIIIDGIIIIIIVIENGRIQGDFR